ncbi:MAG: pseudaminic acid cytidylyltransferase [Omnitrophica WOR_2 bacterium GWF2_38_59]|nr:MAG: pseudaminic acid cytidylyltransferase [Omnitrophica WOR_2 bacterium GWF2_38_59]OGX48233.1 MAG: pseudaminic acid cytidylyltransferase [Omnitrophica WOR_2 bacterium RIFOXYA2_FULL_38_17]OGX59602.1 MAG: pseudaminic acid cytidylyltransferase [Omnitrophica WOR_2 bacterium RIFOXYC2_FULL_38_12]OGX59994.1 MAG: pseudaminic acid cytidylyltransferase [Omnitrophica WOR_2 bacterium RIFOXYB2_FULL_38_16]
MNKKNKIAIITARGGSKRIPNKNLKLFLGHPIIKYSIDAAIKSKCFDEIMVSTDCKDIANIAKSLGASVPFYRSEANSNDFATINSTLCEVLAKHKEMGKIFELCCCIFPAAPFITAQNLKNGMDTLIKHNAYSTFPVTKYSYPVQRALKIENNLLKMLYPENNEKRSQDFDPTYHDTGQFYWLDVKQFIKERKIFSDKTVPIIIPEIEAQDIDNEEDWQIAESKFKILRDLGRL